MWNPQKAWKKNEKEENHSIIQTELLQRDRRENPARDASTIPQSANPTLETLSASASAEPFNKVSLCFSRVSDMRNCFDLGVEICV